MPYYLSSEVSKILQEQYPGAILTSVFARLIKSKTHTLNRLFKQHGIEIRKTYIKVLKDGVLPLTRKEVFCYCYLEDLYILLEKLTKTTNGYRQIHNHLRISIIFRIRQGVSMYLQYEENSKLEIMNSFNDLNKIDTSSLSAILGISKRSVIKNKNFGTLQIN